MGTADPLAVERKRVVRHLQRFTPEQRASHAASRRMGHRQRAAIGEYFYTHPDAPNVAYPTQGAAARAGLAAAQRQSLADLDEAV